MEKIDKNKIVISLVIALTVLNFACMFIRNDKNTYGNNKEIIKSEEYIDINSDLLIKNTDMTPSGDNDSVEIDIGLLPTDTVSGEYNFQTPEIDSKSTENTTSKIDSQVSENPTPVIPDSSNDSGETSNNSDPNNGMKIVHQIKLADANFPYSGNIRLDTPDKYNKLEGITTFRGNNFRDSAFYGTLDINEKTLSKVWTNSIGQTDGWTGVGWNGQPAIVKWNENVRKQMNLYDEFRNKEDFVEVIYGTLDSHVHFYDLETGAKTRESLSVPSSIKGSVTVDPRGYPLLYVGQGINEVSGESVKFGYHIFSLITGEELLFINGRDSFAYLGWGAFDGNPLLDAESDTLILPGENGLIYIIKLNTNYDTENGTISISPEITRYRYTANGKAGGIENSIAIYENKAYFLNNNGILQCLDLSTLTPLWNFPMLDDCDATMGLELENDNLMIYAATEVDRRKSTAPAFVRKFDAKTGNVLWEYSCDCLYDANVNGGILSSPIIGKNSISNMVIYNFSKVNTLRDGKMVALNKENGNVIWEKDLRYYSWSSPVAVYTTSGEAYIVFCDSVGCVNLIDATTGKTVYSLQTGGGNMEGSPAIYNNKIVIGTRGKRIYCIEIK